VPGFGAKVGLTPGRTERGDQLRGEGGNFFAFHNGKSKSRGKKAKKNSGDWWNKGEDSEEDLFPERGKKRKEKRRSGVKKESSKKKGINRFIWS